MKRIYIAGSYSSDNVIGVLDNIRIGIKASARALKEGYAPFCPWLDHMFHFHEPLTVKDYQAYSMIWLEVCEEVWVLPYSENSKGTAKELERARELNIPIKEFPKEWL